MQGWDFDWTDLAWVGLPFLPLLVITLGTLLQQGA